MMRRFTHYFLLSTLCCFVICCQEDEVSTPPKPTLQADKTSAKVGDEISFTIGKVTADAVSLQPYGLPGGDPGVAVKFTEGTTTIKFSYARPGTFQAIVVANNHSENGENIKNVQSDPVTITISSSNRSITEFSFKDTSTETTTDISTKTTIDESAKTIEVDVLYGTDVTKLKATFIASPFSKVTVGNVEQVSGTTQNDFSSPKVYKVTANDGTTSDYTVTVNVTPIETTNTIKSISAIAVSTSADDKELGASVDNVSRIIVIYDTLGTPSTQFDSVRVSYELDGKFAKLKYGGKVLEQDSLLILTSVQEFEVFSQDSANASGIQSYDVYSAAAPKLALSFPGLIPDAAVGKKPTNFNLDINALSGTDVSNITTVASTTSPAGVTVTGFKVDDAIFISGTDVDYSEPVKFQLIVNDTNLGVTYTVTYTVTVTVIR